MIIPVKLIILLVLMLIVGRITFSLAGPWATHLQDAYVAKAKGLRLNYTHWERPYIQKMFKAGLVCAAVLMSAFLFSVVCGPIEL